MDEDIRFTKDLVASTTASMVHRFKCDYKNTFRGLWGVISGDLGDGDTVTVANETDTKTLGVATFGTAPSAGDEATWVADTTDGNYVNDVGDILTFTLTDVDTIGMVSIGFELDPHARKP